MMTLKSTLFAWAVIAALWVCSVAAGQSAQPAQPAAGRGTGLGTGPATQGTGPGTDPGPGTQGTAQGRGRGGQPVQPIEQLKPGIYMVPGGGANSIVRPTSDGVILVDTKLPGDDNFRALMAQIRTITDKPVKYVVVTHHHADHSGNIGRFVEAGAEVIGHEGLKRNLTTYQFTPLPAPPNVVYQDEKVVRLAGVEAQVHHFGRAHTSGDSVVYFPDVKVVCLSDVVTVGIGPLIDYAGGGSALEWQRVLDRILQLDFDLAVPGNGQPLTRDEVKAYQARFNTMIDRARELVRQGTPGDQLLSQLKTDDLGFGPRIPQVERFVAELASAR